jgi:hypothetical protein
MWTLPYSTCAIIQLKFGKVATNSSIVGYKSVRPSSDTWLHTQHRQQVHESALAAAINFHHLTKTRMTSHFWRNAYKLHELCVNLNYKDFSSHTSVAEECCLGGAMIRCSWVRVSRHFKRKERLHLLHQVAPGMLVQTTQHHIPKTSAFNLDYSVLILT